MAAMTTIQHRYENGTIRLQSEAVAGVFWKSYVGMSHDAFVGLVLKSGAVVNLEWFGTDNRAAEAEADNLAIQLGLE